MSDRSIKERKAQNDAPMRNAAFFTSEYLLGAFALAVGFFLTATVDRQILDLPKEYLLEVGVFAAMALVVIFLFWINSALSFMGETQRHLLRSELDNAINEAESYLADKDADSGSHKLSN